MNDFMPSEILARRIGEHYYSTKLTNDQVAIVRERISIRFLRCLGTTMRRMAISKERKRTIISDGSFTKYFTPNICRSFGVEKLDSRWKELFRDFASELKEWIESGNVPKELNLVLEEDEVCLVLTDEFLKKMNASVLPPSIDT